ncbi:MAG TPA: glutathione S-transferase family protein [Woeseiaceae bacterium]|nr:glutathione S-transferase family protein [Woeseiaceae bacterium]
MVTKLVIGNKNYSSWSLRAWLLMREAGIDFEEHKILLDLPGTAAAIARFSSAGRVPVLILDKATVWDTLAISETLAERFPQKNLWPLDPTARAHARSISAEMHSGFAVLRSQMPMNCRASGRKVTMTDGLKADIDRIFAIWSDCGRRYEGGWLFGNFSIADAMYAPIVLRLRTYGIEVPEAARAYARRLLESAALMKWLAAAASETEVIEADEKGL